MPNASLEFIDTNVLVYEWDFRDSGKQAIARSRIEDLSSRGVISSQVAQESASILQKKLGISVDETRKILESYRVFKLVQIDINLVQNAVETASREVVSFWDALIVEAAAYAGCRVLLTEDLSHGQVIRGVRIVNPFIE